MTKGETVYFQALTSCHEPAGSFIHTYIYIYATIQKYGVSRCFFFKELILLFSKDALN